jgi:hypothetical protein
MDRSRDGSRAREEINNHRPSDLHFLLFFFWLGVALTGQISAPLYPNATSGTESLDTQVIILEP